MNDLNDLKDLEISRKFSIFISSSFEDLQEARGEIVKEILKIGHIPIGMEMFHAGESRSMDVINKHIAECDIFVILIGARLGSDISKSEKKSFTEWEYDTARALKKPILAFLLNKDEYDRVRSEIPCGHPERSYDTSLSDFRINVEKDSNRIVEYFSYGNIADLRNKVSTAIPLEIPNIDRHRRGWIPGKFYDDLMERVIFDAAVSQNPFFKRYASRLNQFGTLSERTKIKDNLKSGLAKYFWRTFLPQISSNNISSLFFESGSSIAYVSEEYINLLRKEDWAKQLSKTVSIYTNNILTYMDFILIDPKSEPFNNVRLEPQGPVEEYYGATFGELRQAINFPPPKRPRKLHRDAVPYIEKIKDKIADLIGEKTGLILMAASGIELDDASPFVGPHVGSYYNMLMKQSLLLAKRPTVLFLDEDKFPKSYQIGHCYPVCGPDFTWESVRKNNPLAIAIATSSQSCMENKAEILKNLGFTYQEPIIDYSGIWPMIAANDAFCQSFSDSLVEEFL